ncbi:MAG TPA: NAD(P)-dependent alcohol dehydrogenase [Methylophaga aminisulfidivorans]|uniref:NAD(P)-dependent alcohol dehydrogenase n=2 Tax=root TaxID=1 RepID=A0A7C1ZU78_9GAMM|nr:NAD(P)-dependent alcohol dehydrogenase [Methylophaga sp.]HEC74329.1 NAD(P)-dependent alcohol dehydrogenase [Methylophaga aminisulfidivorans]
MESKAIFVNAGGGFNTVTTEQVTVKNPATDEITVRLHANSLNYHDYAVVKGLWAPSERRIPMADGAGEVIEVGENVTEFKVGDSVVSTFFPTWENGEPIVDGFSTVPGDGIDGYAREYVTSSSNSFTKAPKGWSHVEASTLTTAALTAWRALMCFNTIKSGETVLLQGTGGVSIFALQFAKMVGAKVIATSSSEQKLERLIEMGADHVINYKTEPNWGKRAIELNGGVGVDHVVEIGGGETLEQSLAAVRVGGQISLIGILSGQTCEINIVKAFIQQVRLQGVLVGSRSQQEEMIKAIEVNQIKPVIDKVFSLEDMVDAFEYQESNRHFGKICLEF